MSAPEGTQGGLRNCVDVRVDVCVDVRVDVRVDVGGDADV